MRKTFVLLCLCALGCAGDMREKEILSKEDEWAGMTRSKIVSVVEDSYLGAKPVRLPEDTVFSTGVFARKITLNTKGALPDICASISAMTGLVISVQPDSSPAAAAPQDGLDAKLLSALKQGAGQLIRVNYTGSLHGLLTYLSGKTGMAWEYDEGSVSFVSTKVKTFTIWSAPGKVAFSNTITNQSKETATLGGTSVQVQDTSMATAQTNSTALSFDVWEDVANEVKSLLTQTGSVTMNQAAGTITVRDTPYVLQQVGRYVDDLNARLSRQIAMSVKVWSLEIDDSAEAALNLDIFFENPSVLVSSGATSAIKTLNLGGELSAAIVDGKLKDSTALLKGLRRLGKATQVTSGGGVVMSNQPVPIQAIRRDAYLASSSKSQNEYGDTTTLTPGEVTTGFAMTVIPHILERRRVVLQYTINLSSLDAMEEFTSNSSTIQLPKVSNRSFSQRMSLKMGQTLVLAGFEQENAGRSTQAGLVAFGHAREYAKSVIIITISTESGEI
ncbi:MAG: pilus assembly protein [Deltaproteobacteria bacterium]|jgi:type IVB pilus formation R64 PilN family outer membrane protein|nr:pilus assembly protein [Deltaproteobacteria bacterium]